MTTANEIKAWFKRGETTPLCTHMIIVCDTYDYEDYPVYVRADQDINKEIARFDGMNMQRIMEVYKISLGWEAQANGLVRNI